ncbi:ornithine cyclodeaminase [Lacticaseibacillus absianus]|uniref:ornithine cyclodeaminase n=1 Tax=Lacticaseibacillus absianus TaxID=2729623 RepID=UPI0015C8651A|nr:ornithine cyclodeaminase [Lacticaseibacillus absianus]
MTKIIDFAHLSRVSLRETEMVDWVDDALRMKQQVILPAKLSLKPDATTFFNVMPTIIPALQVAGVKVVNRYATRQPALDSQIMLYDLKTGGLKAIMDGNFITTARTGAVAAHSVRLLAKHDFTSVGVIGLGNQARSAVKALLALFPNRDLTINLYAFQGQERDFRAYLMTLPGHERLTITDVPTVAALFAASEVILSALTYAEADLLPDPTMMRPGTLLVPIHTRGFMNLDCVVDRVYCDDVAQVQGFKYFKDFKHLAEVAEVLQEPSLGRQTDEERITVYNIGLALHDIFFAAKLYDKVQAEATASIELTPPTEKVWYW